MKRSKPEKSRTPTAIDVARIAGVSQSTVSRVFTEGASFSETTRRRVEEAAHKLGYRPNLIARSLITRRSRLVAVAMGYLENQFYPAVLEQLAGRLADAGYRILLFTAPDRSADPILEDILRYRAEAVVLASAHLSSALAEECRVAGVPVVLINRTTRTASVSTVTGDNFNGARTVAAFLAAGGHRRPAYIAGLEDSSTSRERERGFFGYFAEQGLPEPARAVGHFSFDGAMAAARDLLNRLPRPDAIFCANDHTAFAAMQVARHEFDLDIPGRLSVVGFDDVEAARWSSFDLTTFSQPIVPMVEEAVRILTRLLDDPSSPKHNAVIPGRLIVRGTAREPTAGTMVVDGVKVWDVPAT
jgi:DNA-binding LacI/PurR family transcriptional regulator